MRRLDEAKKFGVDTPKGVLLVGMPGCGKSLAAKASARLFNVPLLRLDIGRLLGKYVGESEHNMRVALKTAESISPCILWIDEIEKAFAGINQDGGASDITKRLFGQFLTWLQEKENTVFVVATANDITAFPPEFLRKGRFDEVFFIDFPNEEEREKIFKIHLEKRGKLNDKINLKELAEKTIGYCGADIEEVVKMTVETIFNVEDIENEEDSKLMTQDLLDSIKSIDSLSNILADKIEILKKGYDKFKIKSASKKIAPTQRIKEKFKVDKVLELDNMVFVRGGKYKPSFADEEKEVCNLEVCKYPTTQEMWLEIYKNNPSYFKGDKRPVEKVSWWNAIKFCNEMSKKYNLEPVYNITYDDFDKPILKINQTGESPVEPDKADFRKTEGFRLPTEVEWEWFARGGEVAIQDGTFDKKYSGSDNPDKVAWHDRNSEEETHEVGTKNPNQLGLYDCSGNVWEWCYDNSSSYKQDKKYRLQESELYKYDNRESAMRGLAWTRNRYRVDSYSDFCVMSTAFEEHGLEAVSYLKKDRGYYSIGFRIVRTV